MPKVKSESYETITLTQYRSFQVAFDFFNRRLFDGSLPQLLVTLQRQGNTRGYFSPGRFIARTDNGAMAHELALNPDHFTGRTDEEILSVLAHEMVHLAQQVHGYPPRRGYHDKEFAAMMKTIGLYPSSTGQSGGRETGQKMSHYIISGGPFSKAYAELAKKHFQLEWQSKPPESRQRQSKTKFTCGICGQNAWGKPDCKLICGVCLTVPMTAAGAGPQVIADEAECIVSYATCR